MEIKDKFVAIELGKDKTCERVLECKTITDSEYKKLVNQQNINKQKKEKLLEEYGESITQNHSDILSRDFFIAKSVYDNMVDRGYFACDENFERAFYDSIFFGREIKCEYPKEFKTILEKVRGN